MYMTYNRFLYGLDVILEWMNSHVKTRFVNFTQKTLNFSDEEEGCVIATVQVLRKTFCQENQFIFKNSLSVMNALAMMYITRIMTN